MKEGAAKDYEWEDGWIERKKEGEIIVYSLSPFFVFSSLHLVSEGACWHGGTSLSN